MNVSGVAAVYASSSLCHFYGYMRLLSLHLMLAISVTNEVEMADRAWRVSACIQYRFMRFNFIVAKCLQTGFFFCPAHRRQQLSWAALSLEASTNVIMCIKSSFLGQTVTTFQTYFYFLLRVRSEIKSQEAGGCQNRHVWQHQPSDAAQRCSSRCSQGRRIVCEAGGCIKKSRYCLRCLVFFWAAAGCTVGPRSRGFSQDRGQQFHRRPDVVPRCSVEAWGRKSSRRSTQRRQTFKGDFLSPESRTRLLQWYRY